MNSVFNTASGRDRATTWRRASGLQGPWPSRTPSSSSRSEQAVTFFVCLPHEHPINPLHLTPLLSDRRASFFLSLFFSSSKGPASWLHKHTGARVLVCHALYRPLRTAAIVEIKTLHTRNVSLISQPGQRHVWGASFGSVGRAYSSSKFDSRERKRDWENYEKFSDRFSSLRRGLEFIRKSFHLDLDADGGWIF